MKIIQWNYSRLATIAWVKQECNDYYSIFHLFVHVGLGVLLNDPFGESIASISIPLSFLFVFQSLATQSKEIPQRIHWCVQSCKGDGSTSDFEIELRNTALLSALIPSVQVFVSMNVPQILNFSWQMPSRDYVRNER